MQKNLTIKELPVQRDRMKNVCCMVPVPYQTQN